MWFRIAALVRLSPHQFLIFWTPGHEDADQILAGKVVPFEAYLNHGADGLAKAGAEQHSIPGYIKKRALEIIRQARTVQATLALNLSLRMLCPPDADRLTGWTYNDLLRRNEWALKLPGTLGGRRLLGNLLGGPELAFFPEYREALGTALKLTQAETALITTTTF